MKPGGGDGHSNLLHLPADWDGNQERLEVILQTPSIRIERILSRGHSTAPGEWYDQDHDEWVVLLVGGARLAFDDGEEISLQAGDALLLAAHRRHRVEFTTSEPVCIWLAIHGMLAGGATL